MTDNLPSLPDFFPSYPKDANEKIYNDVMTNVIFNPANSDLSLKLLNVGHAISHTIYIRTAHFISMLLVDYSEGAFLDEVVKLSGITRIRGTAPVAQIRIKSREPMTLKRGTQFTSDAGEMATLMADVDVTPEGVLVTVQGDKEGKVDINNTYVPIDGIESVEAQGNFIQHAKDEDDDSLKRRFKLSLARFSTAGSKESYEYHVHSIGGIKEAIAYNDGAGKVLIVYDGDAALANVIRDTLKPIQPITDSVRVKKADEIDINATIILTYKSEADIEMVQQQVRSTLALVFDEIKIGQHIPHSKFYAYITDHSQVSSSEVDSDTLNKIKSIPRDSILKLRNLTLQSRFQQIRV